MPDRITAPELAELTAAMDSYLGCCLHDPQWTPAQAVRSLFVVGYCDGDRGPSWGSSADNEGWAYRAVELYNGEFGLLATSSDYTGHGCQCDARTSRHPSLWLLFADGVEPGHRDPLLMTIIGRNPDA